MVRRRNNTRNTRNRRGRRNQMNTVSISGVNVRNDRVVEHGSGLIELDVPMGSTSAAVPLSLSNLSTFIPRFAQLMEAYQFFRFRSLSFRIPPPHRVGSDQGCWTVGYIQGQPTTSATMTNFAVASYPAAIVGTSGLNTVSNLRIGPKILLADSQSKWYRSQPSAAVETWEEQQGVIAVVMNAAADEIQFFMQVEYDLELASPIPPTQIPLVPGFSSSALDFVATEVVKRMATSQKLK